MGARLPSFFYSRWTFQPSSSSPNQPRSVFPGQHREKNVGAAGLVSAVSGGRSGAGHWAHPAHEVTMTHNYLPGPGHNNTNSTDTPGHSNTPQIPTPPQLQPTAPNTSRKPQQQNKDKVLTFWKIQILSITELGIPIIAVLSKRTTPPLGSRCANFPIGAKITIHNGIGKNLLLKKDILK